MGFWDDFGDGLEEFGKGVWGATKEVGKFSLKSGTVMGAGAAIASTGGLAAPLIGGGTYLIGKGIKKIGEEEGSEFWEGAGDLIEDIGIDGFTGGLFGLGASTANRLGAREVTRHGGKLTRGAKVLFTVRDVIKIGDKTIELYGMAKEDVEEKIRIYHGQHRGREIWYDSNCPLCNGVWHRLP